MNKSWLHDIPEAKLYITSLILMGLTFLALFATSIVSIIGLFIEQSSGAVIVMLVCIVFALVSMLGSIVLIIVRIRKIYK